MALGLFDVVTLADAQHLASRALPIAPDGRYDSEAQPITSTTRSDPHSDLYKVASSVKDSLKLVTPAVTELFDPTTYQALVDSVIHSNSLDDRKKLFTKTLYILCWLPQGSPESIAMNNQVITLLYNTLPHPPVTYIGTDYPAATPTPAVPAPGLQSAITPQRLPFTFRTADGSGNNVNLPNLGKAGTPYARSVQSKYPLPSSTLPDPGDVFDSLLKARDFQNHPGGNSSLTFAYASLVTHMLFRTDPRDMTKNNTSSYLDLSILYGTNQKEQDSVRDKEQGRGLLYPDAFAEERLIFVPPAATALLVLFSRNHNYIAEMLLKLNERGRWTDPPPTDPDARARQDEEIFQTARLVNCGNFMAMIFGDYVAGFLGLGRDGCTWSMNPFDPIKTPEGQVVGRGDGNQCSVEFNVLYRWHATTAAADIKWTEDIFNNAFKGVNKPLDKLELSDFIPAVVNTWKQVDPDPRTRTFAGLKRTNGRFSDDDLAKILQDATEKQAGAYRARGSPACLRVVEILGMVQARQWGVCTMNEFREFLGLKRFDTFEEWNSDPEIANAARQLYGHIDNLELYPGLQAEEIMGLGPASGLCCGYTMTRAILSDAIALVRGDRFYTTDYTPANLTAWGFQDCARDPDNGAFGAALPRLLFRHLPRHYPGNSAYALFPFFTPQVTKQNLTKLHLVDQYDFQRPVPQPVDKIVDTVADISKILKDPAHYPTVESKVFESTASKFSVVVDVGDARKLALTQALFPTQDALKSHVQWIGQTVQKLIKQHSLDIDGLPGSRLDIVGNVVNLAPIYWVSEFILGIPLKTADKKDGLLTPVEVHDMLKLVFTAVYFNSLPENNWSTSRRASYFAQILSQFIEKALSDAVPGLGIKTISAFLFQSHEPSHDFLKTISQSKAPHQQLVADILGFAVASSVSMAKTAAQIVDFYLDADRATELAEVVKLSKAQDAASHELLKGYVREAQRLNPQFAAVLREDAVSSTPPGQPKQTLVLDLKKALVNPNDFPDPLTINPRRSAQAYEVLQAASFYRCLGSSQAEEIVVEIVKNVFQLPNLQRVKGPAGTISKLQTQKFGVDFDMYTDHVGLPGYWPDSLQVTVSLRPSSWLSSGLLSPSSTAVWSVKHDGLALHAWSGIRKWLSRTDLRMLVYHLPGSGSRGCCKGFEHVVS
ncbi:heme peroxidase [Dichomitus squalens]|uniref:Heme peroxidase n=1 Tax=Dichomitus squalens TaxID=114155 RepID=A0A4Q9Q511_9APHY|nr:heme peroxidase [Dichomitus squalens]